MISFLLQSSIIRGYQRNIMNIGYVLIFPIGDFKQNSFALLYQPNPCPLKLLAAPLNRI